MRRFLLFWFFFMMVAYVNGVNKADTLTIGVRSAPPFLIKQDNSWSGASVDLWESIASDLELNYSYVEYPLDELIDALGEGAIDLSINPLTVTAERVEQFDFTQPFYITNLTIATVADNKSIVWSFVRNFFSTDFFKALLGLMLLILLFGFIIWLVEKRKNPEMFAGGWKGLADGFWWSAVTMTTVGYGDKAPVTPLGRIFGIVWMFTAIIVISGFTASIASSLTVSQLGSSISNVNDLRDVSVGTVKASSTSEFLNEQNIHHITFDNLSQAIKALHNEEYTALVYDDAILKYSIYMKGLKDKITILPLKFNKQYYSFAMPYNTDANHSINLKLIEVIESPYWQEILQRYKVETD
ncbi:MAG: transporter substrate-binding domain-containing protein [Bacteroidales bacterium]